MALIDWCKGFSYFAWIERKKSGGPAVRQGSRGYSLRKIVVRCCARNDCSGVCSRSLEAANSWLQSFHRFRIEKNGLPRLGRRRDHALFEVEPDPNWLTVEWDRKNLIRAIRDFESRIRYKLVKNIGRRSAYPRILSLQDLLKARV